MPPAECAWWHHLLRPRRPGGGPSGADDLHLLTFLMLQIWQREGHTIPLSDLGALLTQDLRSLVKERGGLHSVLQSVGDLVSVTGNYGSQIVTLNVLRDPTAQEETGTGRRRRRRGQRPDASTDEDGRDEDEDDGSALQLRGLPYDVTMGDVRAFLGRHARNLKDDASGQSIHLLTNRRGRPSGFAKVQLSSPEAARAARDELNNKMMEVAQGDVGPRATATTANRYVEAFMFTERPNKLLIKRENAIDMSSEQHVEPGVCDITAEQVFAESCAYMSAPGRGQLLLSMLGVAMSPATRNYLKTAKQGLKQILLQHPEVFAVEGAKGREMIKYLPTMPTQYNDYESHSHAKSADFLEKPLQLQQQQPPERARAPESGNINDLQTQQQPPERAHAVMSGSISDLLASPNAPAPVLAPAYRTQVNLTPMLGTPGPNEASKWYEKTPSIWGDSPAVVPGMMGAHAWQAPLLVGDAPRVHPQAGRPIGDALGLDLSMLGISFAARGQAEFPPAPPPPWDPEFTAPAAPLADHIAGQSTQGTLAELASRISLNLESERHAEPGMPGADQGAMPGAELAEPTGRVKLRGLPYEATDQDVYSFFSRYDVGDTIYTGPDWVLLHKKPNGQKSGVATVRLNTQSDARKVQDVLQGKLFGARYIEVFIATEGEDEVEKSGKQASNAKRGGGAAVPAPKQRQQPQPQQPQQQPQRSPALSAPPRSHAPATATRGMRSPEMRQRVKWVDMTSPSPFTDTGNTGGSGSSTHPPPWEKAAVAKPFGTREHPQTALSAGTGDEVLQKSLLANPRELHAPPPQEFTHQCWDSLLASHFQGGDAPAFSFPPAPPPPWELRLPLTERLLP